jgi:hypothetical protein
LKIVYLRVVPPLAEDRENLKNSECHSIHKGSKAGITEV